MLDHYAEVNGTWVQTSWSLFGRTGPTSDVLLDESPSATTTAKPSATVVALDDTLGYSSQSLSDAAESATKTAGLANHAAASAAVTTSISVPEGWRPVQRATNLYAVPIIITISVLVALAVAGTIVGSVVWRKRRRIRQRGLRLREPGEDKGEKGGRARIKKMVGRMKRAKGPAGGEDDQAGGDEGRPVSTRSQRTTTAIAVGSAGRLRERRRRRAARASQAAEEDHEASTALTSGSRSVPETLTARLSARMRASLEGPPDHRSPSTVFSRDLARVDTRSSTGSADTLSRIGSAYDGTSLRTIPSHSSHTASCDLLALQSSTLDVSLSTSTSSSLHRTGSRDSPGLPLPATTPSPSLATSTFGQFLHGVEAALPSFGPPAYRPNSSTIQATTRLTSSLLGRSSRQQSRRAVPDEERAEPLLWPEEKRQLRAAQAAEAEASTSRRSEGVEPPAHEEHSEPAIDRSAYSAHIATDDKAVLARLRERAQAVEVVDGAGQAEGSQPAALRVLAEASAPHAEDDEVDEDGFELLPAQVPSIVIEQPSLLPLPPQAVQTRSQHNLDSPAASPLPSRSPSPRPATQLEPSSVALGKRAEARRSAVDLQDDEEDESFLPVYLPRTVDSAAMASAPGEDSDEEDDLYADDSLSQEVVNNAAGGNLATEDGREEHAVV